MLSDNWQMIIRLIIISIATTYSIIMNVKTIVDETEEENVDGIEDKVQDWTTPVNEYFREDLRRRDALLIVNAFFIDFLSIVTGVRLII